MNINTLIFKIDKKLIKFKEKYKDDDIKLACLEFSDKFKNKVKEKLDKHEYSDTDFTTRQRDKITSEINQLFSYVFRLVDTATNFDEFCNSFELLYKNNCKTFNSLD